MINIIVKGDIMNLISTDNADGKLAQEVTFNKAPEIFGFYNF